MSVIIQGDQLRTILLGSPVSRPAAGLPQTGQSPLFTVAGGRVLLTSIVGRVTTVIQTQANNTKLVAKPAAGSSVDLCAALNISALAVGTLLGVTGVLADALVGAGVGATVTPRAPLVLAAGTIDLSCAASNTGAVEWTATYVPLDNGASLAAA
jgi:hypothetical protein